MTSDPILKTKLFIPPLQEGMILRPRLTDLLDANIEKKVSFISAPAGFGKSTLLAEWASRVSIPVCWVSLDPAEDDPVKFLSYLISSVQTIWGDLGATILDALRSSGSPPVEYLAKSWINDLSEYSEKFVLILDDFHHISSQEVLDLLIYLIENQPQQLHLLIASRADIPISFSRFRARGEMGVIDIGEMRFRMKESIQYLKSQLGDRITEEDARTMSRRTEGWIGGLHMAVLSMRSTEDISGYVAQFSAADHYITDYLLDEILLRQPDRVEQFLLATSVLDKFTAPLCDFITGKDGSQEIIEELIRNGMFIIPLDTTHTWHRYHHLFADLLRNRLFRSADLSAEKLHRDASDWFAAEGMLKESIDHALEIGDCDLVIERIENSFDKIITRAKFRDYLNWVDSVSPDCLEKKPRIGIVKLFMLYEMGHLDGLNEEIAEIDALLGPFPDDLDSCSREDLINFGIFASIRTIVFASRDFDVENTFRYAALANQLLPDRFSYWHMLAQGAIPFIHRALGEYDQFFKYQKKLMPKVLDAGFLFLAFINYSVLIKAYLETGKLKLALITAEEAIDLDREHDAGLPFARYLYILMGIVQYHSGQLDLAEKYIETGLEQVVRHGEMFSIVEGFAALILVQIAKGDQDQARSLQKELYQVVSEIPSNQNSLAILKIWDARINLLLGDIDQAARILEKMTFESIHERYMFEIASYSYVGIYRVSQTPVRVYLDFLELTKARLMLHQKKSDAGLQLVNNILKRIDEGGNCRYQIEALIVKSLLVWNKGEIDQSEQIFQDAVKLASKEGFIQVFLNEGESIYPLLESVKEKITGDIEQKIFVLKLSEQLQDRIKNQQATRDDQLARLTPREVEVLSSLASGISYAQAADELSISRNTIKTHTKRIYQKLGANGLLQAVNRANQLGLL